MTGEFKINGTSCIFSYHPCTGSIILQIPLHGCETVSLLMMRANNKLQVCVQNEVGDGIYHNKASPISIAVRFDLFFFKSKECGSVLIFLNYVSK
jgi:hypothetical protein